MYEIILKLSLGTLLGGIIGLSGRPTAAPQASGPSFSYVLPACS